MPVLLLQWKWRGHHRFVNNVPAVLNAPVETKGSFLGFFTNNDRMLLITVNQMNVLAMPSPLVFLSMSLLMTF